MAPTTVQFGDTSEFATNGHLFRLSHPPGYPLFTLLLWLFTNLIPFGTVFFKSALLQIILSIGNLIVLKKVAHYRGPIIITLILSLAFGRLYWRYSLLPDVFMLNLFLVSCYSYLFLKDNSEKNLYLSSLVFGLALANHQTSVFLAPLLLYQYWEIKKIRPILKSIMILLLTMGSNDLFLFLLNDESLGSWGQMQQLGDLFHHILRKDYGTFTLSNSWENHSYLSENIIIFIKILLEDCFSFLFLLCIAVSSVVIKKNKLCLKEWFYFIVTIGSFLIFFSLSNVYPKGAAGLLLERFYLMPLGLICLWTLRTIRHINSKGLIITIFFVGIFNLVFNFSRYSSENNFRKDNFLQDHYTHLLKQLPKDSILLISGDTHVFSLYYLQEILNFRTDVTIVVPPLYPYSWYREKLQKRYPEKDFTNFKITSNSLEKNIHNMLISPNIKKFRIFMDPFLLSSVDFENNHVIHEGILMEIKPGKSPSMYNCLPPINRPLVSSLDIYQVNLEVFMWYGSCDYFGGIYHLSEKNNDYALYMLKRALDKVPYSDLYHRAYCEALLITKNNSQLIQECYEKLKLKSAYYQYRLL
jgi:hypothetical protein